MPRPPSARPVSRLRAAHYFHNAEAPVWIHRFNHEDPVDEHQHDFVELAIVAGGAADHRIGSETFQVARGDAFVIPRSSSHGYVPRPELLLLNILIQHRFLRAVAPDLAELPGYHALFTIRSSWHARESRVRLDPHAYDTVIPWVEAIEHEQAAPSPGSSLAIGAYARLIIRHICQQWANSRVTAPDRGASRSNIARVLGWIEEHCAERLTVERLAQVAHMSVRGLHRAFQDAVQRAPLEHVIHVRLRRGAALLQRRTLTVTEVAFAVGFNDSNYFARQFRKVYGTTPRMFRNR